MKIRTDFVSNSSSSSFVLIGVAFDYKVTEKIIDDITHTKEFLDYCNNYCETSYDTIDELFKNVYENVNDLVYEYLYDKCDKASLKFEISGYDGEIEEIAIGVNPIEMSDSETLKDFKMKVLNKLSENGFDSKYEGITFVSGGSDASGRSWIYSRG